MFGSCIVCQSYPGFATPTADMNGFVMYLSAGANALTASIYGTDLQYATTTALPSTNQWHHVAATVNGTNITLYLDGAQVSSTVYSTRTTNYHLYVGGEGFFSLSWFNGSIDDVLIFNRSLASTEIKSLYNATANQYYNNFTSLPDGQYNFTSYSVSTSGLKNQTAQQQVIIQSTINSPPNNATVSINTTDGSNRTLADLNCFANITDPDLNRMNVSVTWFNNTKLVLHIDYNNSYPSGSIFNASLDDANTTKYHNWTCGIRLFDGALTSVWTNSTNLTILNTPPTTPTLSTPQDWNQTTNRTPTFTWSASSDDDSDTVTYEHNITLGVSASTCTEPSRHATGISSTSYTLTGALRCLIDHGDIYNWTVRAYDSDQYSSWAGFRRINISALVDSALIVDNVSFGQLNFLYSNNTTTNSPGPFVLQNNGNSYANVTIAGTDLWQTVANPNQYFQFKIDNTTETNSLYWPQTTSNFTDVPSGRKEGPQLCIAAFNYTDTNDTAEIDIFVRPPSSNEGSGLRSSTITFVSSLGE